MVEFAIRLAPVFMQIILNFTIVRVAIYMKKKLMRDV